MHSVTANVSWAGGCTGHHRSMASMAPRGQRLATRSMPAADTAPFARQAASGTTRMLSYRDQHSCTKKFMAQASDAAG
ncbi:hypothetical protein A7D17_10980 [Xanthomonas floridensis]|uniref:Uncharacterized protein n=1 Tax=Xanthomonas floridensis TaxID=1843580 RepID=A0A1A9MGB1_9XANT|nr:hypothetical protein A7D17_10980 [Xanthomonas floridensis]